LKKVREQRLPEKKGLEELTESNSYAWGGGKQADHLEKRRGDRV